MKLNVRVQYFSVSFKRAFMSLDVSPDVSPGSARMDGDRIGVDRLEN